MNFLQRLPRTTIHLHRFRVIRVNETKSCAAYSICCTKRSHSFEKPTLNPVSFSIVPKRNKSFSEVFTQIYTDVSHSATVSHFQNTLISFHDFTGLPWWATIVIYTVGLRMAMFPLAVYGQKMKGKLHNIIQNELPAMNDELKREVAIAKRKFDMGDKETYVLYKRSFNTQYRKMIERDNCHPLKTTILFWFQIPVWICHSIGIRNILTMQPDPNSFKAILTYTQMTVGGCLWIPNLVQADASLILPLLWCATNLINIELGVLERGEATSKFSTVITGVFRGIIIAIVPIAASVPSCLALYWCTSSVCALGQNLILLSPKVKQVFGIPNNTKYCMERPYRTIAQRFVELMKKRRNWCTSFIKSK